MDRIVLTPDEIEFIRKSLVVNYEKIFEQLLERVKRVLLLDERGGTHLMVPREKLTHEQVIALYLIGRKYGNTIGLSPKDTMSAEEMAKATGIPYRTVTARVSGLRKHNWVESDARGEYRIVYMAIDHVLSDVEAKVGGG